MVCQPLPIVAYHQNTCSLFWLSNWIGSAKRNYSENCSRVFGMDHVRYRQVWMPDIRWHLDAWGTNDRITSGVQILPVCRDIYTAKKIEWHVVWLRNNEICFDTFGIKQNCSKLVAALSNNGWPKQIIDDLLPRWNRGANGDYLFRASVLNDARLMTILIAWVINLPR